MFHTFSCQTGNVFASLEVSVHNVRSGTEIRKELNLISVSVQFLRKTFRTLKELFVWRNVVLLLLLQTTKLTRLCRNEDKVLGIVHVFVQSVISVQEVF